MECTETENIERECMKNMRDEYNTKLLKAMDDFQWFDYSYLTNFLKIYFKETSKMYKECGLATVSGKLSEDMYKVYRMLKYAEEYKGINCNRSRIDHICNGRIFRPGDSKHGRTKAVDLLNQKKEIYKYIFNFIGRRLMSWWD